MNRRAAASSHQLHCEKSTTSFKQPSLRSLKRETRDRSKRRMKRSRHEVACHLVELWMRRRRLSSSCSFLLFSPRKRVKEREEDVTPACLSARPPCRQCCLAVRKILAFFFIACATSFLFSASSLVLSSSKVFLLFFLYFSRTG